MSGLDGLCPLFQLRVTTPRLELRLPTEAEAAALAHLAPDDLEVDPHWPAPDARTPVATGVLQWYWRALGTWKLEHWRLPLGVWFDGEPVGFQELEAERFDVFRSIETSSWLVREVRGRGIGKEMRAAVLALGFDHLGANLATSGAWEWNGASLGVSLALGYSDNGWKLHDHAGRVGIMRNVVLTREQWDPAPHPVTVKRLDACRHWFGKA